MVYLNFELDGTSVAEIKNRTKPGKQVTKQLHSPLRSNQQRPETKINIYKTTVESIVTYGAEVWGTTEHIRQKITSRGNRILEKVL